MKRYSLGIVIVNYGGGRDTVECLESIEKSSFGDKRVAVVNVRDAKRGSLDEGKKIIGKFPQVELIQSENEGFSVANNLGIKHWLNRGMEVVMLLNNDTTVAERLFEVMFRAASQSQVGAASPKIYFHPGREFHKSDYKENERGNVIWYGGGLIDWANFYGHHRGVDEVDHGQFDEARETGFVTGCCMAVRKRVWDEVGLLDERSFLYFEDLDWSLRVEKRGLKLWYEPKGVVWHKNAGSTSGSGSETQIYYQTRNRYYYGNKYAPLRTRMALWREVGSKLIGRSGIEKKATRDFLTGKRGRG